MFQESKLKRIVAYGNPVFDMIVTPKIRRFERVLSGCSTNACLALSYLEYSPVLIGTVSDDFKQGLETDLVSRGINFNLYPSKETGGFGLVYDEKGNRELDVLGRADDIPSDAIVYEAADIVLLGPILNEIPVDLVKRIKNESNALIFTDPQGLLRSEENGTIIHTKSKKYDEIAKLSNIIKANELEALVITGEDPRREPERAVKALYETGCDIAIVTLAEAGSIIFDGRVISRIPPFTTDAIDPTGAGDTYAAGFISQYLDTPDDLTRVGCFASSVASIMVENSGPVFPLTRNEANRRMNLLLNGPLDLKL